MLQKKVGDHPLIILVGDVVQRFLSLALLTPSKVQWK
jgi:hypothetical protein